MARLGRAIPRKPYRAPVATAAGGEVAGTALGNLGGLAGTAVGTRTVLGAAGKNLGGLTGTATGTRTVLGTAGKNLGALTGVMTTTHVAQVVYAAVRPRDGRIRLPRAYDTTGRTGRWP